MDTSWLEEGAYDGKTLLTEWQLGFYSTSSGSALAQILSVGPECVGGQELAGPRPCKSTTVEMRQ